MLEMLTCELCFATNRDVKVALARYDADENPFQSIARCPDVVACRRRVEGRGNKWPLAERREITA